MEKEQVHVDTADVSQSKSGVDEAVSNTPCALSDVSSNRGLQSNIDSSNSTVGSTVSQPLAIELFCGSAGLTATMRALMPSSFGMDHSVVYPKSRVIQFDLLDESNQKLVQEWALHDNCVWVHFGIPCGTSSRARDIRMSRHDHGPPPLRTLSYPDGLPHHLMSKKNLLRMRSANRF